MNDLAGFLLARIDRDAEIAQAQIDWMIERHGPDYWDQADDPTPWEAETDRDGSLHVSPHHALAECEAKRRIVNEYQSAPMWAEGERGGLEAATRFLALPYADHPDYRQEWTP